MASMYGGQGASAAVEGYKSGYKFQQDSETAYQESQLREEKIKQAKIQSKLWEDAYADVDGGVTQANQQAQEITQLKKQVTDANATTVRKTTNRLAEQGDAASRGEMINTFKARFKTNPEIYKALGIKNANTMSVLNPSDSKDRAWMMNTLD